MVFYFRREKAQTKAFLVLSLASLCLTVLILGFNYLTYGIFEINPTTFFIKYINLSTLKHWISYSALVFTVDIVGQDSRLFAPWLSQIDIEPIWNFLRLDVLYDFFPLKKGIPNILSFTFFLTFLAGVAAKWRKADPPIARTLLPIAVALIVLAVDGALISNQSFRRSTIFTGFYVVVACLALWSLAARFFVLPEKRQAFAIVLALLLGAFGIRNYLSGTAKMKDSPYRFFAGLSNYREAYGEWIPESCLETRRLKGGEKVLLLNFFPGCYILPGIHFERPLMNSYLVNFAEAMYQGPEEAKKIFLRYDIHYFLVDLKQNFHLPAFSPLFEPSFLEKSLKIVWESDGAYLLTWRNEDDEKAPEAFLESYRDKYQEELTHWVAKANERTRAAYAAA
jgi:hypothetical protein